MSKSLVVYYSRRGENHMPGGIQVLEKGNTEYAAEYIRDAVQADLFQIDTAVPYAENYRQCCQQAVAEAQSAARPELKEYLADVSGYDTIFVCYPCWCGTAPMSVFTFLERYDLAGTTIVPLCTHEGSGLAHSEADIQKSCPGSTLLPGLAVRGHQAKDSRDSIAAWAEAAVAQKA